MSEEDVKNEVILPFLNDLGFKLENLKFEENIKIILGKNKKEPIKDYSISGRYDILVKNNGYNFMMFEIKTDKHLITADDIKQGLSYARALADPVPFTIITNGKDTKIFRSYDGIEIQKKDISLDYNLDIEDSIKYRFDALKNIICYSKDNLNKFLNNFNEDELKRLYNYKFIPELYIERQDITKKFDEFLFDKKKVFMIEGKSGMGKTNIICGLYNAFKEKNFGIFYNSCYIRNSILETIKDDFGMYFTEDINKKQILDRLSNLGKECQKDIVIYIDAIDEIKTNHLALEIDELIKGINQYDNIKLCLTCKKESIEEIKTVNGVDSHLQETDTISINVEDLTLNEKENLIYKYSTYYNCYVSREAKAKISTIKNPFIIKVIFMSYINDDIPKNFEKEKVLDKYLKLICKNNSWDYLELRNVLKAVGTFFCEHSNDFNCVDEFELNCLISNQNTGITLKNLYSAGILEKYELDNGDFVGFYYNIMGYYIINVISKNVKNITTKELLMSLYEISNSEFGKSSLIWYSENIGFKDQDIDIIYKFNKDFANKKLLEYREIVNTKFPNIKDRFECNTDINNVGIALFNADKIPNYFSFAFFRKEINDEDIIKVDNFNNEIERTRFIFKKNILSITVVGKLDINKIVTNKLEKMIKESNLYEKSCKNLLEERIINLTFILSGLLKHNKKEYENYLIPKYQQIMPINLDKLKQEILQLIGDKENLKFQTLSDSNYKNNTTVSSFFNYIELYQNEFGDNINDIPWKYPSKYIEDLKSRTIDSKIVESFGITAIQEYVKDIYIKYISEYQKVVENNFNTLKKYFSFYNKLKEGIDIKIFIVPREKDVFGSMYGCVISATSKMSNKRNEITVIYEESIRENEIFMQALENKNSIFCKSFDLQTFFFVGYEDFDIKDSELGNGNQYCVIKNHVYSQLLDDFKDIKDKILN